MATSNVPGTTVFTATTYARFRLGSIHAVAIDWLFVPVWYNNVPSNPR